MNSKQIKSSFEIYEGAKFKNGNDAIIEIVRKDDDGYVLFKTHNGSIHDTTEESMLNILEHNGYIPIESSHKIQSRFYQSAISKYTLSEAAQYMAALFFDLRSIHFLTTGNEFYTYHKLAEELYEKTEDFYDDLIETAIGYDSDISAMYVLPGDWDSVNTDGSFNSNAQVPQTLILDRLEKIYDVLESVKEYDSMVKSKLDAMLEYYDKEIYKLKQALK